MIINELFLKLNILIKKIVISNQVLCQMISKQCEYFLKYFLIKAYHKNCFLKAPKNKRKCANFSLHV